MISFYITNLENEEYYVVGDIHADFERLFNTYSDFCTKKLKHPFLKLIYLGDYLDRGLKGTEVIDFIDFIQHKSEYKDDIYFILGNHEVYKYTHTLAPNDPTEKYSNRLEYFRNRNLTFYLGYYNVKRKLLFTHGGVLNPSTIDICWIAWHEYLNNKANDNNNRVIQAGYVSLSLSKDETFVHDTLFYSFKIIKYA